MANSSNTTWIVSCMSFRTKRNGSVDILHCDGRSYRSEQYARDRYNDVVDSLNESGYSLEEIGNFGDKVCEGVCGCKNKGGSSNEYTTVYITRNPVWTPHY